MTIGKIDTIRANTELSKLLAPTYEENEPHYKIENKIIVKRTLKRLKNLTWGKSLLDLGCGTGFILDLAKDFFTYLYGVDISKDMLSKVKRNSQILNLKIAPTDNTSFENNHFDVCTAYSVLHHLPSIKPTLKEAFRVLKEGGVFYSGLDPNFYFYNSIKILEGSSYKLNTITKREVDKLSEERTNYLYTRAEPLKQLKGGFKEEEIIEILKTIGFSKYKVNYYWFLGEGQLIHSSIKEANIIRKYLKSTLPISRPFFKYLEIMATK